MGDNNYDTSNTTLPSQLIKESIARLKRNDPSLVALVQIGFTSKTDPNDILLLAKALKANTCIRHLFLSQLKIKSTDYVGLKTIQAISDALKTDGFGLELLVLSNNFLQDTGVKLIAEGLTKNTTLVSLDLSGTHMGYDGVRAIVEAFTKNKLSKIEKIKLQNNYFLDDDGALAIARLIKCKTSINDVDLLYNEKIENRGDIVTQSFCEALAARNTLLSAFSLSCRKLDDNGARLLSETLKNNGTLTKLSLAVGHLCDMGEGMIAEALECNTTLKEFNLTTHKGSNILRGTFIAESLRINTALIVLGLSLTCIYNEGAIAIGMAIKTGGGSSLVKVNLSKNYIKDDGAISLADMLKSNTTILEFDLSENDISDKGAIAFATTALPNNRTLKRFNLMHNKFGDKGANAILKSLQLTNDTVTQFNVYCTEVGYKLNCQIKNLVSENETRQRTILPYVKAYRFMLRTWALNCSE